VSRYSRPFTAGASPAPPPPASDHLAWVPATPLPPAPGPLPTLLPTLADAPAPSAQTG